MQTVVKQRLSREPQQLRAQATKDFILQGAIGAIARNGNAEVSIRAIAGVAGVSVGSIYEYFDVRQSLMASVYQHCTLLRLTTAERAFQISGSFSQAIAEAFSMPSPVPLIARRVLHSTCTAVFGRSWWQAIDTRVEALTCSAESQTQPFIGRLIRSTAESA